MKDGTLDLRLGELHASVRTEGDVVHLDLRGNADVTVESTLAALVTQVDEESRRGGASAVVVDIRGLEFMNSSCFKSLISWILAVRELPVERRYTLRLCVDPAVYWQRRSLSALSFFGGDVVVIQGA